MSDFGVQMVTPEKIRAELKGFQTDIQTKAVRAGLIEVAKPITKTMKSGFRSRSGALKRSIGRSTLSNSAKSRLGISAKSTAMLIGPNRKVGGRRQSLKAVRVDQGTKPHIIKPKDDGALMFGGKHSKLVKHPGAKAANFIANAMRKNEGYTSARFYKGLSKALAKYA
jgi:hypothetical protein